MNNFESLNISITLLNGIKKLGYQEMTDIQEKVLPEALANKNLDIVAQAPTGTGKTCTFAIPILESIDFNKNDVQALILAPTRELANQIKDDILDLAIYLEKVRVLSIFGGEDIEKQFRGLKKKPQIIVATPGRLIDHMERKTIDLSCVSSLVLDEADEMLDMGFREDIDTILSSLPKIHRTMLFFATMSKGIMEISKNYLNDAKSYKSGINPNSAALTIEQKYINCKKEDKIEIMSRLIDINSYSLVIVFCNTKLEVDSVTSALNLRGFNAEALHGDMRQMQRDNVLARFKSGKVNILVASDVAARGLDIDDVDVVFNYDVPTDNEYYVHRIGRTGRANKKGLAIILVTKGERYRMRSIIAYSKSKVSEMEIPPLELVLKARAKRLISNALKTKANAKEEIIIQEAIDEVITKQIDGYNLISGLITMKLNEASNQEITLDNDDSDTTRIFISLGRNHNYNSSSLVKLISTKADIKKDDINKMDVHDTFSFFNIPTNLVDQTITSFFNFYDKNNKRVVIEEAKKKNKKDSNSKDSKDSKKKNTKNTSSKSSKKKDDVRYTKKMTKQIASNVKKSKKYTK